MKSTALSCCRVYSMLLPVLPGPENIFWPVLEKSSAKKEILSKNFFSPFSAKFGQNSDTNSSSQLFISRALFELFGRNFGHLATLASEQGRTHKKDDFLKRRYSHTFSMYSFAGPQRKTPQKFKKQ